MRTLASDLRHAVRLLARRPGFTVIAILALALGIGANSAVFSLVNAVLLQPLPYPDSGRLAVIWEDATRVGFPRNTPAPANYFDWKHQNHVFEDMAAIGSRSVNLTGEGEPVRLPSQAVEWNFFQVLGVQPSIGRTFTAAEDEPGAARVAVISHGLWQSKFGGDRAVVNREIHLNGAAFTVIGVMPRGFHFINPEVGVWLPFALTPQAKANRGSHYLTVVGRLKPGVSWGQAQADLAAIMARIERDYPGEATEIGVVVVPLRDQLAGQTKLAVLVLLAAVACILLIACANVANLLLSRAVERRKEIALRYALGATRSRLVRQLLTESALLAAVAAMCGLALATVSQAFLQQLVPRSLALNASVNLDARVLLFTAGLAILTAIVFGLTPALQSSGGDVNEALKQGGRGTGMGVRSRLRSGLVVAEVAVAVMLLVGAGLLIRTFVHLRSLDPGYQPDHVVVMTTQLPNRYAELPRRDAFYEDVLRRVRSLPGVVSAAYVTAVPFTWRGGTNGFSVEGRIQGINQDAIHRQVTPDYFATMRIPVNRGRGITETDRDGSMPVAVINETMARAFWPNEDPVGKRLKIGSPESPQPWRTIVGVVGDVRQMGLENPPKFEFWFHYAQMGDQFWAAPRDLVIRTAGDPAAIVPAARAEIAAVDKDQPVSGVMTLEDMLDLEVAGRRLQVLLLGSFSFLALLLASIGLYGVLSYAVSQRTQEIGVRMALGATRSDILRMLMGEGLTLAGVGALLGAAAAIVLTRLITSLLYGVRPADPATYVATVAILLGVAILACFVPARRALKVDPMVALRYE